MRVANQTYAEKPLTSSELCDLLGMKWSTLYQYNREGMTRFMVGKECRYIPSKVLAWLERRSEEKTRSAEETFDPRKEVQP